MIAIALENATISTGNVLKGSVQWKADADRRPRRIIIAAEWETEGFGKKDKGRARAVAVTPGRNEREASFPVRFMIPYEGPVTFEGTLIKLRWILRVRVDQFGFDEFAEKEFRVEPRRR